MSVADARAAEIAAAQDNVITLQQLRAVGLGHAAVAHRLKARRLQRLHHAVYLMGAAPPTRNASLRAAVLACGARSLLSHRAAAELWRILAAVDDTVHVTVVGRNPRARDGITLHRINALERQDLRQRHRLPLTAPARTICDLAASEPVNVVERAIAEAQVLGILNERELRAAVARAGVRKGTRLLRRLLEEETRLTRNDMERLLLKLIAQAGLPRPLTNTPLLGYNVDFLWPAERLVVEFDGFAAHGHRRAFERDRRRDARLAAAGYRVIRVTWWQLTHGQLMVIADLAQALRPAA